MKEGLHPTCIWNQKISMVFMIGFRKAITILSEVAVRGEA